MRVVWMCVMGMHHSVRLLWMVHHHVVCRGGRWVSRHVRMLLVARMHVVHRRQRLRMLLLLLLHRVHAVRGSAHDARHWLLLLLLCHAREGGV